MKYYATIDELINSIKQEEVSYRNTHTSIYVREDGEIIKIPYKSILREYRDYFKSAIMEVKFLPKDETTYNYKPKALSLKLYNTTELWSALLELNNVYSIAEFVFGVCKIYEPRKFKALVNEVLILEDVIR